MTQPEVPETALELRSTLTGDGVVTLGMVQGDVDAPTGSQVVVRVEAAPDQPVGPRDAVAMGDISRASAGEGTEFPAVTVPVSAGAVAAQRGRIDKPMPTGNEGGGTVVAADRPAVPGAARQGRRVLLRQRLCPVPHRGGLAVPRRCSTGRIQPMQRPHSLTRRPRSGMVETMRAEGH
ncbi:MAG: hypothetical protein IPF42_19665 [Candidatus Microthrix sp.]|nr:hypothetical protein [Candidatus Microthrix sp.]